MNALINNLPMHTENESLIHVLNAQPCLVENSAESTLTYNLPLLVTAASSILDMAGIVMSSVTAEPELYATGLQWPDDINT